MSFMSFNMADGVLAAQDREKNLGFTELLAELFAEPMAECLDGQEEAARRDDVEVRHGQQLSRTRGQPR